MKSIAIVAAFMCAISLTGCAVISAKQPYRGSDGVDTLITGTMQGGKLKIYYGPALAVDDSILNFGKPMNGVVGGRQISAMCKHTKHFFSVENECDVFVDGKFAANLYLR